jgi:replicative DNA helicase
MRGNQQERIFFNERAALGSIVINNEVFVEVVELVGSSDDMFSDPLHKDVWRAMLRLNAEHRPIDYVTLSDLCRSHSPSQIAQLDDAVPVSSSAAQYAGLVRDAYVARKMYAHAKEIKRLFEADSLGADKVAHHMSEISGLTKTNSVRGFQKASDILRQIMSDIEYDHQNPGETRSIRTGIPALDKTLDCLRPDTLNVIGARPSVGKSALAANIAINASRAGHPVLFISLEMRGKSVTKRLASIDTGVAYKILSGSFQIETQKKRLFDSIKNLEKSGLTLNCPDSLDIHRFRSDVKRFAAQQDGMPLIILDYLQLAKMDSGKKNANRYEQIGEFTRESKLLAGEIHCPIVLLCQLSREADAVDDPFRCMPFMRESGNIENDADTVVVMLKRLDDGLQKVASNSVSSGLVGNVVNCAVIKNRDFETGPCPIYFDKPTQRMVSLEDFLAGELARDYEPPSDPTYNPLPEYDYEEDDTPF